jgi:hypothetical protein
MMQFVPVSIIMASAALEANVNETIKDFPDDHTKSLTIGRKYLLKDLENDRSGNSVQKYRQLAWLFDKEPDTSTTTWDNAKLLVKFRNSLMHFKPAWDHEEIHSGTLVTALKSKIPVVNLQRAISISE